MGDSLLRSDCDSAYSQGVRMYIVSKYKVGRCGTDR
jgi:hypothetical protein